MPAGCRRSAAPYEQESCWAITSASCGHETDPARPLAVESLLAGTFAGESLASSVVIADGTAGGVVHQAALLGVDLLSGEEGGA